MSHMQSNLLYRYGQTTWRVSDRYEQLEMIAAEVLVTPYWKHLAQQKIETLKCYIFTIGICGW
jgi:hypothetical protein